MARPKSDQPRLSLKYLPAKSCYYAELFLHNGPGGRPRKSLQTDDKKTAEAMLEAFRERVLPLWLEDLARENGKPTAAEFQLEDPSVAVMADWYTGTHLPYLGRAPKTIAIAEQVIGSFVDFGKLKNATRFSQLSSYTIQQWQIWRSENATRMRAPGPNAAELTLLRTFLRAVADNFPRVKIPELHYNIPARKKRSRFRALSVDELRRFLSCIDEHAPEIAPAVHWLAITGWRSGDVLAFTWDMLGDDGLVRFTAKKTKNEVELPVTSAMRSVLKRAEAVAPGREGFVFRGPGGGALEYNQFQYRMAYVSREKFGANVTARDLRKTLNTLLLEQGADVKTATALLGNVSDTVTLQNYHQVNMPAMQRQLERVARTIAGTK